MPEPAEGVVAAGQTVQGVRIGAAGALALSGNLLIAARGDSPKLSVWDLRKGAKGLVQTLRGYANNDSLCYDVERARLVVGDRMGAMRLWSMPGAGRAHV